ncbi:MAG: hypothetical protein Q4F31_10540, partial [Eubacteriales bacterium]|nr:hypothetical protein [Eubacteriales bacterium]
YNVQFIEELYSFYRREAFSKSFFHNIRTAIFELEHSLKFCSGKDEKLIQNTIDNLLYTLIAIGREANKEMDSEFFEDYNSSRDSLCLMEKNEE